MRLDTLIEYFRLYVEYIKPGQTHETIAKPLGITREAVCSRFSNLGLPGKAEGMDARYLPIPQAKINKVLPKLLILQQYLSNVIETFESGNRREESPSIERLEQVAGSVQLPFRSN
jgi:predicted transcriptional regulator